MRTRIAAVAALATTALLAGCTGSPEAAPESPDKPTTAAAAEELDTEIPETAAGAAAAALLALLEPDAEAPSEEEVAALFSPEFLAVLPYEQLVLTLAQLRDAGPYPVVEVTGGDESVVAMRLGSEPPVLVQVQVDDAGLILGFPLAPDTTALAEAATTLPDLDAAMTDAGAQTQTYVARVEDGACTTVYSTDGLPEGGEPAPSGSVVKLAVLSVVVDAVDAGDLAWDTELTITPELKSLPSGELQDRPDGDVVTVQEAAELMISISDNTATDLLIDAVGPETMTAAMPGLGVEDAERFDPFLTTRGLFLLGWAAPDALAAWPDADPAERQALLDGLPADVSLVDPQQVGATPVWEQGVDWFLSGGEICSIYAALGEQAQTEAGAPVMDILTASPGLVAPDGVAELAFKGGSVTGIVANAHLMETEDGDTLVYVSQVRGDPLAVSTATMLPFFQQGLDLAAQEA